MLLAILTFSHFQKRKRSLLGSPWQGGVIDQDTFQKFLLIWINWCGRGLAWRIGGAQKIVHAASFPGRTLNLVGLLGNPSSRDPWDSVSRGFCPARATFGQRQRPIWPKFGLRPLPLAGSSSCSSVDPSLLLLDQQIWWVVQNSYQGEILLQ